MDVRTAYEVLEVAGRAPSVHNTQPWRWLVGTRSLHLLADRTRAVPATDPHERELLISCGAALHHLRVALASRGMGSSVRLLPNAEDPDHLAAIRLTGAAPRQVDVGLVDAVAGRRSDRRTYSDCLVPPAAVRLLVRRAHDEGAVLKPLDHPGEVDAVVDAAATAAATQEADRAYGMEMLVWSGRGAGSDEGVLSAVSPRAPTGFDRRFPWGVLPSNDASAPRGGRLVVLATLDDTRFAWLRAGAALSAVLLTATSLGLASCTQSQPFEVSSSRAQLRERLLHGRAHPHLIVRVGHAPAGPLPPRTPRRRVREVAHPLPGVPTAR
ncbi:Acg family FMN-binding oxidoreductase [Actinokineospora bangkokensis]|uniref:Nitroreductase domain-containing protein n=1 Tax=Actinokineospora bangkokensis TaxID=1193682 RepID=A0A1Q9LR30_9PSEU|nr:nitroreductase family protein [Actinokineospora bangkokensis]OLR94454.1 hypothetical protein BJP25_11925 [Actinokineospora bangkokensis]